MWRSLLCVGVALGVVSLGQAQDRQIRKDERQVQREVRKGQVVRVNPETNTIVVLGGAGAEAKEFEYRVAPDTKYWGTDRRVFKEGLRHKSFREGTEIWYAPGTGIGAAVSELWLADPNNQGTNTNAAYVEGKIVRVDPATNRVVVRTDTGELEYRVDPETHYWGTDQQPFTTGLRYQSFREGTPIWFQAGAGERNHFMSEVRFYNPVARPVIRQK